MAEPLLFDAEKQDPRPFRRGVLLVGRPNVGKSVLFGALTRSYVTVSNYPGTTVEISSARTSIDGESVPVMDTPGTHSFIPSSEEERVTRDILLEGPAGMSVVVGRIRACPVLGLKMELLSHNTVRGAAGGTVLNAELLAARGLIPRRARG